MRNQQEVDRLLNIRRVNRISSAVYVAFFIAAITMAFKPVRPLITTGSSEQHEEMKVRRRNATVAPPTQSTASQKGSSRFAKPPFKEDIMNLLESVFRKRKTELPPLASPAESDEFFEALLITKSYIDKGDDLNASLMLAVLREIFITSGLRTSDVVKIANSFFEDSQLVHTILLYGIASNMYELSTHSTTPPSPDELLLGLHMCQMRILNSVKSILLYGGPGLGVKFGIRFIHTTHEQIIAIEDATPDEKALKHAWSYYCAGYVLSEVMDAPKRALSYYDQGLEILRCRFGSDLSKYKVGGSLLDGLGVASYYVKELEEAKTYFERAIEARERCEDCDDESKRILDLRLTNKKLELVKEELDKNIAKVVTVNITQTHGKWQSKLEQY